MSRIKKALKRVAEGRHRGTALARGSFHECECLNKCEVECPHEPTDYAIIKLDDGGKITVYGSDHEISIDGGVKNGDEVMLHIIDNEHAYWGPVISQGKTSPQFKSAYEYCNTLRENYIGRSVWVKDPDGGEIRIGIVVDAKDIPTLG